jgi:thiamine pyrophosphate-dependent acetolactate synthase large subunit-like protein
VAAVREAVDGPGRTVVLGLPLDVQARAAGPPGAAGPLVAPAFTDPVSPPEVDPADIAWLAGVLRTATRPVFIAGRGATRRPAAARAALTRLADRCGALLAVSAAAKGLFAGDPWYLDVSGGFATPLAAELIGGSDLVVAWGSTLNMWTTRHGRLIPAGATVAPRH